MEANLQNLNARYAIPGQVTFEIGPGGLVTARIENEHARAAMTLAGAHVMAYQRISGESEAPLLWASPSAANSLSGGMRGGVPVCWPWFGAHPGEPERLPLHGFVRTQIWQVASTRALPDGATEIVMSTQSDAETRALWPHEFTLELRAVFGESLRLEWTARNPGSRSFTYTGAIHPYYAVSEARQVTIRGLEDTDYLDKNGGFERKKLRGALRFEGPVDWVFLDTSRDLLIDDPGLGRRLRVAKTGSRTTVVWNPHDADALQPDVGQGNHRQFVCAEAANAFNDAVTVEPGGASSLSMEIWIEQTEDHVRP